MLSELSETFRLQEEPEQTEEVYRELLMRVESVLGMESRATRG